MKKKAKKFNFSRVNAVVFVFLTCLIVLAISTLFSKKTNTTPIELFRDILGLSATRETSQPFSFDPDKQNKYGLCDGKLVVLSPERFVFYNEEGFSEYSEAVAFENPQLCVAGDRAFVYDISENSTRGAFVASSLGSGEKQKMPVYYATGTKNGQYAIVSSESGYHSIITLYSNTDKQLYVWRSENYIISAGISPLGKFMATAEVGEKDGKVNATIVFLDTEKETPLNTITLPDVVPIKVYFPDEEHTCIIAESMIYFFTNDGKPLGTYPFSNISEILPTETILYLLTDADIICVSYETAKELCRTKTDGFPIAADVSGNFISVICDETLTRYSYGTDGLTKNRSENDITARKLLQNSDGSVLLIFDETAEWRLL